jgi:hypothetical protein
MNLTSKRPLISATLLGCIMTAVWGVMAVSPRAASHAIIVWLSVAVIFLSISTTPCRVSRLWIAFGVAACAVGIVGLFSCSDYSTLEDRDIIYVVRFLDTSTSHPVPGVVAVVINPDGDESQGVSDESGRIFIRHRISFQWNFRLFGGYGVPLLRGCSIRAKRVDSTLFSEWSFENLTTVVSGGVTQDGMEPILLYTTVKMEGS